VRATSEGPGRALVTVYGVLALAACARGGYEVAVKFDEARLAYSLALFAGVVYAVATFALATNRRWLAWPTVLTEMVGVLVVGTLSFVAPALFQRASVWSWFGAEYLLVPLVLPFLGVAWLRRSGRVAADEATGGTAPEEPTRGAAPGQAAPGAGPAA
jgi:hypothetical protein